MFIVRKDDRTLHYMFSGRKIVRVDHKMSDEEYYYATSIWSDKENIVPFIIPSLEETDENTASKTEMGPVTVEMVQKNA